MIRAADDVVANTGHTWTLGLGWNGENGADVDNMNDTCFTFRS